MIKTDGILLGTIFTVSLLVLGTALSSGEFWWTDESRHAMDGAYFLDVMRDLPITGLYEYTVRYFSQYPALGLNWYPPFFAFVEGILFSALGASELNARLTVLLFWMSGLLVWYFWSRSIWGRGIAFLSCLLFLANPELVKWTRAAMLEAPAVAMIILSVASFDRYLKNPGWRSAFLAGIVLSAALLLKQTTAFMIPVLLGYALLTGQRKPLWSWPGFGVSVIVLLAIAALSIHALKFGEVGLSATIGHLHEHAGGASPRLSWARWTLYLKAVAKTYPWPFLLASFAGFVAVLFRKDRREQDTLIILWLAAWFVAFTLVLGIPNSAGRYTMYAAPPLSLLACRSLSIWPPGRYGRSFTLVALACMAAWGIWVGLKIPLPTLAGYAEAARFVNARPNNGAILFSGKHDGNFIFNVRNGDEKRKQVILRSDKILVSMAVHKYFGIKSYVKNANDIYGLLDQYHVGTIVVEDRDLVGLPEFKLLNETLKDNSFRLVREIPLKTNIPELVGVKLLIYDYLNKKISRDGETTIPLLQAGQAIHFHARETN